ncbi:hypothetical protein CGRA01v4_02726 [Colletotrichum graminicola]|nr:hypothetical protein CGRA01v4_02726 [Colletotrichum graminicola]
MFSIDVCMISLFSDLLVDHPGPGALRVLRVFRLAVWGYLTRLVSTSPPHDYLAEDEYEAVLDESEAHCFVGRWSILHRLADWKRTWARIIVDEAHQGKKDDGKMFQNLICGQSNAICFVSAIILANYIRDLTVLIITLYRKMWAGFEDKI